jgi:hypothetical protein
VEPVAAIERPFIALLEEAIIFAQVAENLPQGLRLEPSLYPRASIIASALALECAANCCVQALPRSGQLRDDIDRLPLLSKFDLCLSLRRPAASLDRGAPQVQSIQELKAVRDSLVHPRGRRLSLRRVAEGEYETVGDRFPLLGISRLLAAWRAADAISVLRAASAFYRYFYLDQCQLSATEVATLLLPDLEFTTPQPPGMRRRYREPPSFREAFQDWSVDFTFLLGKQDPGRRKARPRRGA